MASRLAAGVRPGPLFIWPWGLHFVTPKHPLPPTKPMELTHHPGEIRSQLIGVAEALDWELFSRSLMSFLDTDTLRSFTEELRSEADIDDLLSFEGTVPDH